MEYDAFSAGVKPGGLVSRDEIKILICYVMSKIDNSLIGAAEDLGSNRFNVIRKVIFPLSLPGVISGITMVFVPSVSTFYISQKLGGNKTMLIGDVIEYLFNLGPDYYNVASSISLVLMMIILVSLFIMNRVSDGEDGGVLI
jgi:spermidine/putrescine transport system permease protein